MHWTSQTQQIFSYVSTLDEEIAHAVQAQSLAGQQASKDIFAIEELLLKINDTICLLTSIRILALTPLTFSIMQSLKGPLHRIIITIQFH